MFHSKELFSKITSSITAEDLTFLVTKKLFEHLKTYSNEVDFLTMKMNCIVLKMLPID